MKEELSYRSNVIAVMYKLVDGQKVCQVTVNGIAVGQVTNSATARRIAISFIDLVLDSRKTHPHLEVVKKC